QVARARLDVTSLQVPRHTCLLARVARDPSFERILLSRATSVNLRVRVHVTRHAWSRSTLDSPSLARRAYHRFCPLSMALEQVGDRWTLHIVYALLNGPKRYADLQAFLRGAGSNVLADRLRRLAESGIIGRSAGATPGSDTTYHLTERGREL